MGVAEEGKGAIDSGAGEFLTGDLNLVRVQAIVQYRVAGPEAMVVAAEAVDSLLRRMADASLSRTSARNRRGNPRRSPANRPGAWSMISRAPSASHRLGLEILGVSLTEARPPSEVAADFAAAKSAESRTGQRVTDAQTLAETILTESKARAQAVLEAARASMHRRLLTSRSQAATFLALLTEAQRSRGATVKRIYIDTMN